MSVIHATQRRTLLIVDDDFDLRETLVDVLEDEGFQVRWARDGADALAELQVPPRVDLIVLDLNMPVMDGTAFRATQRADARFAAIPVLVLSGAAHLQRAARDLSAAAVVAKPFTLDRLLDTLRRTLKRVNSAARTDATSERSTSAPASVFATNRP